MTISKQAENFVLKKMNQKRRDEFIFCKKGEMGFDIRNTKSTHFIEVKGTLKRNIKEINFRYLTNEQHKKAESCILGKKIYQVFLVIGVNSKFIKIARIYSAKEIISRSKKELWWRLPILKVQNNEA